LDGALSGEGRERLVRTSASESERLAIAILMAAGVPADAAELQAGLLVEAELRGHPSHGLLRLPRLVDRINAGVADPVTRGVHRWIGDSLLEVKGQQGLGPVVAVSALEAARSRVRTTGVVCVTVSQSNHLGMLAWYAERIAADGLVGLCLTTSEAIVHPWGGREAQLGTNPIAIGVPALPAPFVLDMATSAASMGKVHDYANRNLELEPCWAVDADGNPTQNPAAAVEGALTPFGGPKGYGLAIAFEVLIASLTTSALGRDVVGTLDSVHASTKGDMFIVVKPPGKGRLPEISAYLDLVRGSAPRRGDEPVRVPGDGSRQRRSQALRDGFGVPDEIWRSLLAYPRVGLTPDVRPTRDRPRP
jgi:LDH2 family malate/lactate/ureidoglycolate dehydrogenase